MGFEKTIAQSKISNRDHWESLRPTMVEQTAIAVVNAAAGIKSGTGDFHRHNDPCGSIGGRRPVADDDSCGGGPRRRCIWLSLHVEISEKADTFADCDHPVKFGSTQHFNRLSALLPAKKRD